MYADVILRVILFIVTYLSVPFNNTASVGWNEQTEYMAMSGCAAYYAEDRMATTATVLDIIEQSSEYKTWLEDNGYIGAVAVYRLGDKWRDVHILWPDGTIDGPYIAIDVVARHHYELGLKKNRVIDVDYNTAKKHNMRGPMAVTIIYDGTDLLKFALGSDGAIQTGLVVDEYKGCINQK